MSSPIDALVARARAAADDATGTSVSPAADREKLQRLASEFESMLLNEVLQDMRKAGRWNDGEDEADGYGAEALFETLDAELSKQLSRAQGFGLARQLMDAFDRLQGLAGGRIGSEKDLSAVADQDARQPAIPAPIGPTGPPPVNGMPQDLGGGRDVTSGFGWRRDPLTGEAKFHRGVDLRAAYGEDVAASAGGKVAFSGTQGGYGTTVVIEHANGTRTRYAHLSLALVAAGDAVEPGQLVGRAGNSGRATGPHVHLEVLDRDGTPINPLTQADYGR